jgi:hypothetical protein
MDRRQVLASTGVGLVCPCALCATPSARGCALIAGSRNELAGSARGIGVVPNEESAGTGDARLDRLLGRALARLADTFEVRPNFSFYDDSNEKNALAKGVPGDAPGTWGLVLMGRRFYQDLQDRFQDDGVATLLVLAHEFAHIAQFQRKTFENLVGPQGQVKRAELHADLLAGFHLGLRKAEIPDLKLREAGLSLYQIGDFHFNTPDHHGTPDERIAAAEKGFALAGRGKAFSVVFNEGRDWVLQTFRA